MPRHFNFHRTLLTTLAPLGLMAASGLALAEVVTPSTRVVTSLNVRGSASSTATVTAKLRAGDYAVLAGSTGSWYQITLPDGRPGYVSKSWSSVEPDLRLGTWNLKKLGHGTSKDYPTIAAIIEENFDILTVIEVMQKNHTHPGYDALLQSLGANWTGEITDAPRPNTTAGDAEYYAVLYRTGVVRPCANGPALRYFSDNDGSPQGSGADRFVREPAFACYETTTTSGQRGWDFILAGYHATWSGGDEDAITAEAQQLAQVFAAMQTARAGEHDLLIAGDYNLTPDVLREHVNATDKTAGTGSTINSAGNRTANLYDHLLVLDPNATREQVTDASVIDARSKASSNKLFYQTVSDHLPIMGRFARNRADDD